MERKNVPARLGVLGPSPALTSPENAGHGAGRTIGGWTKTPNRATKVWKVSRRHDLSKFIHLFSWTKMGQTCTGHLDNRKNSNLWLSLEIFADSKMLCGGISCQKHTLHGTNISHLGKRKIFQHTLGRNMLVPGGGYEFVQTNSAYVNSVKASICRNSGTSFAIRLLQKKHAN